MNVLEQLKAGKLPPAEAVAMYERGGVVRSLSEVPLESIYVEALDCGFPSLNKALLLKKGEGEMIIVAARTSTGKSAFVLQVAKHVAETKHNVLVLSTEMGLRSILTRLVATDLKEDPELLQSRQIDPARVRRAYERINQVPWHFVDSVPRNLPQLGNLIRHHHSRKPIDLVVVDYLQNLCPRGGFDRVGKLGEISHTLRELSREIKCPFLVAAQLNRDTEKRGFIDKKQASEILLPPRVSDIEGAGAIEQDADMVVLLFKKEADSTVSVNLAKNRNGRTRQEHFGWENGKFVDTSEQESSI